MRARSLWLVKECGGSAGPNTEPCNSYLCGSLFLFASSPQMVALVTSKLAPVQIFFDGLVAKNQHTNLYLSRGREFLPHNLPF